MFRRPDTAERERTIARLREQQREAVQVVEAADDLLDRARDLELEAIVIRDQAETKKANAQATIRRLAGEIDVQLEQIPHPREAS